MSKIRYLGLVLVASAGAFMVSPAHAYATSTSLDSELAAANTILWVSVAVANDAADRCCGSHGINGHKHP